MSSSAIVLAAGGGTRMRSDLIKVAHEILGVPVVRYVVNAVREAGVERTVVVTGHQAETVEALLEGVEFARQDEQLGTGHAVQCALRQAGDLVGPVVVLAGDVPLVRPQTIAALVARQNETGAACVILSALFPDPTGYGRVIRDDSGAVEGIVEHKDLPPAHRDVAECNVGIYCFDGALLSAHIHRLEAANAQREFYLTDMVGLFKGEGLLVDAFVTDDVDESHGINTRVQLAQAAKLMQRRINEQHMLAGVTMVDPDLVWVGPYVEIGPDTTIAPMSFLLGRTTIGANALVGPNTRATDSQIGDGATVDSSILDRASVGEGAKVGPVAYLRPGTVLAAGSKAGTCVEIKNSTVGEGSKVPHLSYIGDATIGKDVNVGAGTITCNYDGVNKHATVIEDGAFVGSDTMLVAPVRIGRGAVTGAASAITKDVPAGALGLERSEQRIIEGWKRGSGSAQDSDDEKGSGPHE